MLKNKKLRMISPSIFLEEGGSDKSTIIIIISISITFLLLILWAMFARTNSAAVVFGEVEPENKVEVIEHYEGGIVKNIYVKNGDNVKKGQPILTLNVSKADAALKQLLTREIHLKLDLVRLHALKNNQKLETINWNKAFNNTLEISSAEQRELLSGEIATYKQSLETQQDKIEALKQQITKHETEVVRYKKLAASTQENLALYRTELKMFATQLKNHYVSKRDYIIVKRRTNETEADYISMKSSLAYAKSQVSEHKAKLNAELNQFKNNAQEKIDNIHQQLAELKHQLSPLKDQVKRHIITSPIDGTISNLQVKANYVIAPKQQLLVVVPKTPKLIINARLNTKDIGHIAIGDTAKIKVLTYDYTKYGLISGKVTYISANTKYTNNNTPYFEAHIQPNSNFVNGNYKLAIKTGMTSQVDIITGHSTVLKYLLNPIQRNLTSAMRES